jgi:hypothetical protein
MKIPIKSQSNLNRSCWEEDFLNAANQNASLALAAIKQNYVKYHFINIPAKFDSNWPSDFGIVCWNAIGL